MKLLTGIYAASTAARNSLYESGFLRTRKLKRPVISIGNVSTGGSGKTPFTILLGELLMQHGRGVDVLSRGYRRSTRGVLPVDATGSPEEFGDEPLLIAKKLGCPVIVGEDRYAAGLEAEKSESVGPNAVHLLDDGFQHRSLARDFDIVLLNREDLEDKLLPAGRLREPLSAISRAQAVVVDPEFPVDRLHPGDFSIWRVERLLEIPPITGPVIAFCGIARPQRFFSELRKSGLDVRDEITFRDHHRYSAADVEHLSACRKKISGCKLVATEKDAINLGPHLAALQPLIIPMGMELRDPQSAIGAIDRKLGWPPE
jgi:tetraacyldisaccharide 4'-kinase